MAMETQAPSVPMVTLTIDGKEVRVPKGTNVIEAARSLGIDIPYLCYHHQLSPFGGCRLCLVDIEKVPKLLAACNTPVAEGMVVRTSTDRVKSQREGSLEFILLNHPLDCPVCDKGGECELQDRVFEHGNGLSRMTEPKVHVEDYDLGPLIVRNQDRCIICKRCVTVMEEIAGEPVLEFGQRGVTTEVYTFEHESFRPGFSGNTIRVCPVGALMSKPFRFRARPWELIKTPGICGGCAVGCNLRQDVRENRLLRVVGLENPQVNDGWLCDRGQFGYDYINSAERLTAPLVRRGDRLEEASWEDALALIAQKLSGARAAGGDAFAAIGSERSTNEDCFVLQKLTREVMGSGHIDHRMGSARRSYLTGRPSAGAIEKLPSADVVLVIGSDVTAEAPVLDLVLKRSLLTGKSQIVVASARATALDKRAAAAIRYQPGAEIALVNALIQATLELNPSPAGLEKTGIDAVRQGFGGKSTADLAAAAGADPEAIRATAALFSGARTGSILYGSAPAAGNEGGYFLAAIENLALISGQAAAAGHVCLEVVTQANTWGARNLGLLPDVGVGGVPAATRGGSTADIFQAAIDQKLQVLWIQQSNPVVEFAGGDPANRGIAAAPFVVVQDLFLTETAALADVVLPSVSLSERNGTLTSIEGRVQRTVRGMDPRGAAREDWKVLVELSERLGASLGYGSAEDVVRDIRTAYVDAPQVATPKLQRVETPRAVGGDSGFPLRLFTGRLMFDRGTIQGRSSVIPGLAPDPAIEVNPADAARAGLVDGAPALVTTAAGRLELPAKVTEDVPAGAVFVPFGYNSAPVGALMADGSVTAPCRIGLPGS